MVDLPCRLSTRVNIKMSAWVEVVSSSWCQVWKREWQDFEKATIVNREYGFNQLISASRLESRGLLWKLLGFCEMFEKMWKLLCSQMLVSVNVGVYKAIWDEFSLTGRKVSSVAILTTRYPPHFPSLVLSLALWQSQVWVTPDSTNQPTAWRPPSRAVAPGEFLPGGGAG